METNNEKETAAREVVLAVRAKVGRTYKATISDAWMFGYYSVDGLDEWAADLQNIRNTFGPAWLADFRPDPVTNSYPLFKHMADEHGLTLIESELHEIVLLASQSEISAIRARVDALETILDNLSHRPRPPSPADAGVIVNL